MLGSDRTKYVPLAVGLLACTAATLFWRWYDEGRPKPADDLDEIVVELLPIEKILAGRNAHNPTSVLTWFHGDYAKVMESLRERASKILQANPWLAGRIVTRKGEPILVYKANPDLGGYFDVNEPSSLLARDDPLSQLGGKLADLCVQFGPTSPEWKIVVIPCHKSPTKSFAVIMSMSHALADGHTFYRILNMLLDSEEEIEALNVNRIMETEQQQIAALGGEAEYKFLQQPGFIVNCIYGALHSVFTNTKTVNHIYTVNQEAMEAAKKIAAQEDKHVQFVSTNDVITSWFLQNCRCKHGLMALNFRGKLDGHTESHAGNYENVVFFRADDSASPALIRKSITTGNNSPTFQRRVTVNDPMPNFWTMASGSIAIITNWASFAKPCLIKDCEEDIQVPLYDLAKLIPSTMAIAVIFRAGPKGIAMLIAGPPDKVAGLEKQVPILSSSPLL
mmetsp:Transcript_21447/g.44730  ORF Transcript_21447/g.44730 Transcript_21447/m.44730 type:complete len:449 (-) Transcript_21447:67-1413(-)